MLKTTCEITRYDGKEENEAKKVWVRSSSRDNMVLLAIGIGGTRCQEVMVIGKELQLAVENCLRNSIPPLPGPLEGLGAGLTAQQRSFFQRKAQGDE